MPTERLEPEERKCIRMGLICPCGTVSEHEEGAIRKTASAGVSTNELKDSNKKHHHKKQDSPSKRPLVASGDSTDSFKKFESHRQSRGISCTPREIKKTTKERTKRKERRSRSSSSHHGRAKNEGQGQTKPHHRHHSYDGNAKSKKSTTLTRKDDRHHRHYGGTDVTKLAEIRISAPPHANKPCTQKTKSKSLPVEKSKSFFKEEQEQCQAEERKKSKKQRPKPPAYVIPVASTLK